MKGQRGRGLQAAPYWIKSEQAIFGIVWERSGSNTDSGIQAEAASRKKYAWTYEGPSWRRRYISRDIRRAVWLREQGKCTRCGCHNNLVFEYIIPVSGGGTNVAKNMELLCEDCNKRVIEKYKVKIVRITVRERGLCPGGSNMSERRGSVIDRRSGEDRRQMYSLDYFMNGGSERRKGKERRTKTERRKDWVRVSEWLSVFPWDTKLL